MLIKKQRQAGVPHRLAGAGTAAGALSAPTPHPHPMMGEPVACSGLSQESITRGGRPARGPTIDWQRLICPMYSGSGGGWWPPRDPLPRPPAPRHPHPRTRATEMKARLPCMASVSRAGWPGLKPGVSGARGGYACRGRGGGGGMSPARDKAPQHGLRALQLSVY